MTSVPRSTLSPGRDRLLPTRLCDLPRDISRLRPIVDRVAGELRRNGLPVPTVYLSDGFFAKDGRFAVAVPFYLVSQELREVERHFMGEVEGDTATSLACLIRHEVAHAMDSVLGLHRTRAYQRTFGRFTRVYPTHYRPDLSSDKHVRHLPLGYAQAHPAEDFAETFAVWLDGGSRWQTRYAGSAAVKKLQAVEEVLEESRPWPDVPPFQLHRPLWSLRYTLATHYRRKLRWYGWSLPAVRAQNLSGRPALERWAQRASGPQVRAAALQLHARMGLPALTSFALLADVIQVSRQNRHLVASRVPSKRQRLPISALMSLAAEKLLNLRPGIPV